MFRFSKRLADINKDIGESKTPHERIIHNTNWFWILILIGVIIVFWNVMKTDRKEKDTFYKERYEEVLRQLQEVKTECRIRDSIHNVREERASYQIDSAVYEVNLRLNRYVQKTVSQRKVAVKQLKEILNK